MEPRLARLEWDSGHFQLAVSRLEARNADEQMLDRLLNQAAQEGVDLVYCSTAADQVLTAGMLSRHGGRLVDRKTTFAKQLGRPGRDDASPLDYRVRELPRSTATPALLELAILAGQHSRFRNDARIPTTAFMALYHRWMERSTLREIADMVFVAETNHAPRELVGMITVARHDAVARIGLVAVARTWHGRKVGSALMRAVEAWSIDQRIAALQVVTQGDNLSACRLYERCGYTVWAVENVYHFWPRGHLESRPIPLDSPSEVVHACSPAVSIRHHPSVSFHRDAA